MKRKSLCIVLPVLITIPAWATNNTVSERGRGGNPSFDRSGRLTLLVCGTDGGSAGGRVIRAGDEVEKPRVRTAADGTRWAVWQETEGDSSQVFAGRLDKGEIRDRLSLSSQAGGHNHSPDLATCPGGGLWTVWIHARDGRTRIAARKLPGGDTEFLPVGSEIPYSPRIILDGTGTPWAVWNGSRGGPDRIRICCRRGGIWSRPRTLSRDPAVPNIHPALGLDENGYPLAAWSAFDGTDYEIRLRAWNGSEWGRIETLTRDEGRSDVQPDLTLFLGGLPVIAWTRSGSGLREILLSWKQEGKWRAPIRIASGGQGEGAPMLAVRGEDIAVAWSDRETVHARSLFLSELEAAAPAAAVTAAVTPGYHLDEQVFTAFGDSITFGSMDGPYQAEGYPPRLETLLEDLYTSPRVSNRGVPGEPTWEAVSRVDSVISSDLALWFLLMEGTNDVTTSSYSLETTAFNLGVILEKCRDFGVFPLIATIIPRARSRWTNEARERTLDLNQRIASLAEELGVPLIDQYAAFDEHSGGAESLISDDNLHPNLDGYQVMAETWHAGILRLPFPPVVLSALVYRAAGEAVVTWEPDPKTSSSAGIIAWRIYRKTSEGSGFTLRGGVSAGTLTFSDTSLNPELDYLYAVSAVNRSQVEGPLSRAVATEPGEPDPPLDAAAAVVLNKAYLFHEHINRITWSANPANQDRFVIAGYRIYRKRSGQADSAYVLMGEVDDADLVYLDRGFASETEALAYVYGVSAVDSDGNESPLQEGQR